MTKQNQNQNDKINQRRRIQTIFTGPSMTKQSFEDETNINKIIARYKITGELPEPRKAFYADTTSIPDYRDALDIINQAEEAFESLPAKIRGEFMNDPGTMLKWLENPNNRPRAIELGLIEGDTSKIQPQPPEPKNEKIEEKKKENLVANS